MFWNNRSVLYHTLVCYEVTQTRFEIWALYRYIIFANWSAFSWVYIIKKCLESEFGGAYYIWNMIKGLNIWNNTTSVFSDVLVIRIPTYTGTCMLVSSTRSWSLDSATSGNPLLYPISVSDCTRPEHGVLIVKLFFFKTIYLFLTYLVLAYTPTPSPHTPKNHTPQIQRYPPPYDILLLFSLYLCSIRQYFLQILIVSAYI